MADAFATLSTGKDSPAEQAVAVTPDDDEDLAAVSRALYVGTGGNVAVILVEDTDAVTFANVPDGAVLPVRAKRVLTTGTTASDIVALS